MTVPSKEIRRFLVVDQGGAISYLVALLLPVMFGMSALVMDLGHLWQVRRHLQNCADAAALAGVSELDDQVAARAMALNYLEAQGSSCFADGISPSFAPLDRNNDGVPDALEVIVVHEVPFIFAQFLGFDTAGTYGRAVAGKMTPIAFLKMEPFGLQVDPDQICGRADVAQYTLDGEPLEHGKTYIVKYSAGGPGSGSPGNFQPLALGSRGASEFRDNVALGYQAWTSSCDSLTTEPGNVVGATLQGLDIRLLNEALFSEACNDLLAGRSTKWYSCPRVINIAIIPPLAAGRTETEVLTFGWFYLLDYQRTSSNAAQLKGIFLDVADRPAPPEEWQGDTPWDPSSSFPFGVKLLE